jgi:hypothetical protein
MSSRSASAVGVPVSAPEKTPAPIHHDTPPLSAVSFSRMNDFEECAYRALLKYSKKYRVQEPQPPADVETPLSRGSRVHDSAENYVRKDGTALIPELLSFRGELEDLRERMIKYPKTIELEQMWCFKDDWTPTRSDDWTGTWLRVKQDVVVRPDPSMVIAIDYKTGKKAYNEIKHNTQLRLGMLGASFRYPAAETFIAENWYLDLNDHTQFKYTRAQVIDSFEEFDKRLRTVTTCVEFQPNPSAKTCRFCPFRSGEINQHTQGTGDCPYAASL